jgi:cytochrome c oxidase subunit 3
MESASIPAGGAPVAAPHTDHEHEHHGPPAANQSSRLDPQFLGMLLFIISEVMLFGAFFTAYFFIRVVNGDAWPAEGEHLPVAIAGVNTAILVSSSFTMHWALEGARRENRRALRIGLLTTLLLGLTFLCIQINEYFHIGFAVSEKAQSSIFYGLTGLHGAHVFVGLTLLTFATIRAFRGHFSAKAHLGVEVPGIYWHFVDVMWIVVYATIYII